MVETLDVLERVGVCHGRIGGGVIRLTRRGFKGEGNSFRGESER